MLPTAIDKQKRPQHKRARSPQKFPGFTLVELLIAILLGATVGAVTLQATRQVLLLTTRLSNHALAWERGQNVLSIIEARALHTGLGITYQRTGDLLQRSFGGPLASSPPPGRWTNHGPVQIWRGMTLPDGTTSLLDLAPEAGGTFRGQGLALLYAVPSALCVKLTDNAPLSMDAMHEGGSAKVRLLPHENLGMISARLPTTARNDLRSWVTFPLMKLPVQVSECDPTRGDLTIHLAQGIGLFDPAVLSPYDEMHYLRAERFQVQKNSLYSEELKSTWTDRDPRVEGVLEMWFAWTPAKKLLEAWILTTGGPASFGKTSRPSGWPTEAPWYDKFTLHDLTVVYGSWVLKNL